MKLAAILLFLQALSAMAQSADGSISPECNAPHARHEMIGNTRICYLVGLPPEAHALSINTLRKMIARQDDDLRYKRALATMRDVAVRAAYGKLDVGSAVQLIGKRRREICGMRSFFCRTSKEAPKGYREPADAQESLLRIEAATRLMLQRGSAISPIESISQVQDELRWLCMNGHFCEKNKK